jgi:isocitrate/isopropylmalate dehydrogenase
MKILLLPGDGVAPEIMAATALALAARIGDV